MPVAPIGGSVVWITRLVHERENLTKRIAEIDIALTGSAARRRGAPFTGGGVKKMPKGKFRWSFTVDGKPCYGPLVDSHEKADRQRKEALRRLGLAGPDTGRGE